MNVYEFRTSRQASGIWLQVRNGMVPAKSFNDALEVIIKTCQDGEVIHSVVFLPQTKYLSNPKEVKQED